MAVLKRGYTTTEIADNYSLGNSGVHSDVIVRGTGSTVATAEVPAASVSSTQSSLFSDDLISQNLDDQISKHSHKKAPTDLLNNKA